MDCEIRVQGELNHGWTDWFEGMAVTVERQGQHTITTLSGAVTDQSALRGILNRLWDLNLTLISVRYCSSEGGGLR